MEGLVGPLAMKSTSDEGNSASLIDAIVHFAMRAVSGRQPDSSIDRNR
jgi:hypothetical protein